MSRNLFGISAKGVVLKAAFGLYIFVFCQAIVHDTTWLWILSIFGGLIILAQLNASKQAPGRPVARRAPSPFFGTANEMAMPAAGAPPHVGPHIKTHSHLAPRGVAPHAGIGQQRPARSIPERRYLSDETQKILRLVLRDNPPICLN